MRPPLVISGSIFCVRNEDALEMDRNQTVEIGLRRLGDALVEPGTGVVDEKVKAVAVPGVAEGAKQRSGEAVEPEEQRREGAKSGMRSPLTLRRPQFPVLASYASQPHPTGSSVNTTWDAGGGADADGDRYGLLSTIWRCRRATHAAAIFMTILHPTFRMARTHPPSVGKRIDYSNY